MDHALIFEVYDHIIAVYVLIVGVYALIFSVYEGIFGDYELILNVSDLSFGDYAGEIAANKGICGVLKGEIWRLVVLKSQFFAKKCCLTGGLQA